MKHTAPRVKPLLLFALAAIAAFASKADAQSLRVGEKIRYSIFAEGLKIGTQTMEVSASTVVDGREAYHIKGRTTTSSLLSVIYRLDDKWDIFMDKDTLYPFRVEKDYVEGKDKGKYIYEIDQEGGLVHLRNTTSGKSKVLEPKNLVFDLFSLIYYYRSKAGTLPDLYTFDFLETKSVSTVQFQDLGEEEVKIFSVSPHYPCRVRRLKQIGGVGVEILMATDELHLPLKLITPAKLSKKKTVNIEFVIDGYSPENGRREPPQEYRRLKY